MAKSYDAIIIGGGHNGLTAAAYLARAGRRVLVLERRHVLGGAAVSEEIYPGFTYSVCSYVVSLMRPWIVRDLKLAQHGLDIIPLETSFSPLPDGRSLLRTSDAAETRAEIARFSPHDAEVYGEWGRAMSKMAQFAKPMIDGPIADPTTRKPGELLELLRLGRHAGAADADELELRLQLMTASAVDLLDEWFDSDVLKAPMSVSGIIGTMLGVRSPGTAYVLLHHYMGEIDGAFRSWGFARGGTGMVSESIANAARSFGATIRTEAPVERVLVRDGRVGGVVLENGEEIHARAVVSGCDPRRTFLGFVGEEHLPSDFVNQITRFRFRGSSGKVNLALDALPEFSSRPNSSGAPGLHLRGDIAIAPSIDYLERAFDEAKSGHFSSRPYINIVVPSVVDPSVAPPGKHVMSCFVQYAPWDLEGGPAGWPEQREAFGDAVMDTLAEHIPNIKEITLHRQVLTPWDLQQEFGLSEGNIFHGELSLEQLAFLRPASGWARYRTPLKGLWLAGSGAHPGGGIMAAPGALCAKAILGEGGPR